jgi:WD40 repeat protein/tRNA A-37 threonylcarbamoyl transferase component Bud32
MDSPAHVLSQLFVKLFRDDELRQLVGALDEDLPASLPGPAAPLTTLASAAADLLDRHGLVNHDLFDRLQTTRSARVEDIRRARYAVLPGAPLAADASWVDGRYTLLQQIGQGGSAEVWQATEAATGSYVALKILIPQAAEDPRTRKRFRRGAELLAQLRHPSLVIVREPFFREGERVGCVMDYVPGITLAAACTDHDFAREDLLAAILAVGEALAVVHAKGIVHRDVSPNNIMIAPDRPAVLVDFDLIGGPAYARLTSTTPLGGTVPFIAPELLDGDDAPTAAADVYGLAMTTLFALVRGDMVPSKAMRDLPALLTRDEVPHAVRRALKAALDPDPTTRTASIADFCRSLKHAIEHPDLGPRTPDFTADGTLILWTPAETHPPALESADLRLWPAAQVERHLRENLRDGTDLDRLRPYTALLTAAAVLALRGQRPAWIGLTPRFTPVFVFTDGHLVLHDDGVPDPDDLHLARAHAVLGTPLAILAGSPPASRDVLDLAQEIRRSAHDDRNLRELARFSKSSEAHEGLTPYVDGPDQPVPAVDALFAAMLARPAIIGLVGVLGSGKTHTLKLLAARLAHSAMTAGTVPVVYIDARGWQPPLSLPRLLQARGYAPAAATAVLLAASTGECVLLLDGLDAPAEPIDAEHAASQIRQALPSGRVLLAACSTLPLPVERSFGLSPLPGPDLRGFRAAFPASHGELVRPSLAQHGWLSLLDVPLLALHLFRIPPSDTGASLAPALAHYIQLWCERLAGLSPRTTVEQLVDILETVAVALWFGRDEIVGDAIPFEYLRTVCPPRVVPELLVDGTLLVAITRRTVTATWLAREAVRRSPAPLLPFDLPAAPPRPSGDFAYFVHDAVLEWLIACHVARRLAAGDLTALRGARPSPMLRAFCPRTPHWPQAREQLAPILLAAASAEHRENAFLLALGDPTLASTPEQPWRLAGIQLANLDLGGVRLLGADLSGACLRGSILRRSALRGAKLTGADLAHANLRGADCDGVTATNANFTGANLDGVSWRGADLRGAVFAGSRSPRTPQDFTGAHLEDIDTTGAFWHGPIGHPALPRTGVDHPAEILAPHTFAWLREARWTRDGHLATIDSMGHVVVWRIELMSPLARWHAAEFGHTHLELSADDRTLVTWTEGAHPRLWDLHTRAEIHVGALAVPTYSAAWAPHGDTLVLCATDGSLWIWHPDQPLHRRQHPAGTATLRFLDAERLALHAAEAGKFFIHDLRSRRDVREFSLGPEHPLHTVFAASSRGVATRGLQSLTIRVFPELVPVEAASSRISLSHASALDWSPDGRWIVTTLERGPCLWSVDDGQWSHSLQHRDAIRCACLRFSPDSRHIVGILEDSGLALWDVATGKLLASHRSASSWVHAVALSADRRDLLAASDHSITQWNPATLTRGPTTPYKDEYSVALAPDAAAIVSAVDRTLVLTTVNSGRVVLDRCTRTDHAAWDRCHFTSDGRFIVARISDGERQQLAAWDHTGNRVYSVSLPDDALYQSHTVATARGVGICSGQARTGGAIVDMYCATGRTRIAAPHTTVYALALDAGEHILASAGQHQRIVLWDLPRSLSGTGTPLGELSTDWPLVEQLRFAPRGPLLAAASGDAVYLFDASSQSRLRKLSGHGFRVHSVAFSGDMRYLVAGDYSGQVRVWSIASGEQVATFHLLTGETSIVTCGGRYCTLGEDVDLRGWFGTLAGACHPLAAFRGAAVAPDVLAAALPWDP